MTPTETKLKAMRELGQATKCQRHPVILGLRQLLQKIRQEFCRRGGPIDGFDPEECAMAMGPIINDRPLSS